MEENLFSVVLLGGCFLWGGWFGWWAGRAYQRARSAVTRARARRTAITVSVNWELLTTAANACGYELVRRPDAKEVH